MRPRKNSDLNLTRDIILEQALVFVKENGLSALTMKKMALSFGVSEPAIYYHFNGRNALVSAIIAEIAQKVILPRTDKLTGTWREKAWRFLEEMLVILIEYPETSNYFLKYGVSTVDSHVVSSRMVDIMRLSGMDDEAAVVAAYHAFLYLHGFVNWHELRLEQQKEHRLAKAKGGRAIAQHTASTRDAALPTDRAFYDVMSRKSPHERFYSGLRLLFDGLDAAVNAVKEGRVSSLKGTMPTPASYNALTAYLDR